SRQNWMLDYADNIKVGDAYWESEIKDSYSRIQNIKRYTFKVPGYKTDAELDAIYAQRKAAGTLNPLAAKYGFLPQRTPARAARASASGSNVSSLPSLL